MQDFDNARKRNYELIVLYSKSQAAQLHVGQQQQRQWSTGQNKNSSGQRICK
jgi:hypothetical protein